MRLGGWEVEMVHIVAATLACGVLLHAAVILVLLTR
jgi:hypothetical protein